MTDTSTFVRSRLRLPVALVTLVLATAVPAVCFAQKAEGAARQSMWQESWPTFSWLEGVATIAAGVGTIAFATSESTNDARWHGGILFDDSVREGLRLKSASARKRAASVGDWPYYTAAVIPLIVDPVIVAWIGNDDPKAAANLAATGLEAFSYSGLLSFVSTRVSARERPDSEECNARSIDGTGCGVDTESFWSGHTTIAATSAGLVCAEHAYMPLWKYPTLDVAACVLSTTGAVGSGVSRILADRHYASDVIIGGAVGFGIGYAVPVFLHFTPESAPVTISFRRAPPCNDGCLSVGGTF
jgi:membrane-associated phospholipid phosphatase